MNLLDEEFAAGNNDGGSASSDKDASGDGASGDGAHRDEEEEDDNDDQKSDVRLLCCFFIRLTAHSLLLLYPCPAIESTQLPCRFPEPTLENRALAEALKGSSILPARQKT
jgi:hypothetical protein